MPLIAGVDLGRRRGPFLSAAELLVLAGIVSALLAALFPGRDFENPVHLARPDELSIAYLRMLLRAHPKDAEARLLLVQQQKALGRLEEAHETLSLLQPQNDEMAARMEVVTLSLDRARLAAMEPEDPRRPSLMKETHAAARRLMPRTQKVTDLSELADFVLSIGDPGSAAQAYRRLATLDPKNRLSWLEKAARWSEASGQPGAAARLYAEAAALAVNADQQKAKQAKAKETGKVPDKQPAPGAGGPAKPGDGKQAGAALPDGPRLARLAMRALLAANEGKAGLAVARPLVERYPNDLELLEKAIRMAVAGGDLQSARRWGEQRVIAAGSSDEALRQQSDILLKAGDPVGALRVAKVLLERAPEDVALRRQVAQLARWSGEPEESLEHYSWLARRGAEDARLKSLELSRALADSNREIEMLELSLRRVRRMAPPPMGGPAGAGGAPRTERGSQPAARPRALPGGGSRRGGGRCSTWAACGGAAPWRRRGAAGTPARRPSGPRPARGPPRPSPRSPRPRAPARRPINSSSSWSPSPTRSRSRACPNGPSRRSTRSASTSPSAPNTGAGWAASTRTRVSSSAPWPATSSSAASRR